MKNININMDNESTNSGLNEYTKHENANGDEMGSLSSEDKEELDDEIEPRLKYERVGNDISSILGRDAASCLSVHSKFLAVGTQWGGIYIMDHVGNVIENKTIVNHSTTVNQISIDNSGEYLASCSDDGKVKIHGLYTPENNQVVNFDRPIKSVAIDPNYGKSNTYQFVTGDTKVILHEKGFIGRLKSYCLHENSSIVQGIKWQSIFIAWSSNYGVHIYDMSLKKKITLIVHMKPTKTFSQKEMDECRCTLFWKNERTLIIARLNTIQVCVIKDSVIGKDGKGATARIVEIILREELDFVIAGLCYYNDSYVILSYTDACQKASHSSPGRPHLRIINLTNGDEITNDALSIKGFQSCKCSDYHLECCLEEGMFFIVSPKDIVVARQRDKDDHLDWLIEHEEFQEALEFATNNSKLLKKRTCQDVGFQWFTSLFDEKRYREAANLCPRLFGRNKEYWESYIIRFRQFNQLAAMAHVIPLDNPRLDTSTYEMVLYDFLTNKNGELFMELIKNWSDLYDPDRLIDAVMDQLEQDRNNIYLLESLGHLYTKCGKYEKAFYIYVKLGRKDIFELICEHNLFDDVILHVITLMDFNAESTVGFLIRNVDKIPPNKVISQLRRYPEYLLSYLSQLIKRDQHVSMEYHQMLVELYAEHAPKKLLPFIQMSSFISLQTTLDLCKRRNFVKETIYLLDRMGNSREALRMMLKHDDNDVDSTINFCKNHADSDLWQDLIQHSVNKPEFVIGLLNNIGGHVDPILLIRQIKERMEIPGLRDALIRIINDYNQQVYFHERCSKLANADLIRTFDDFISLKRAAISIDERSKCGQCMLSISSKMNHQDSELVLFHCQHVFHISCLHFNIKGNPSCPVCAMQKSTEIMKLPSISLKG